MGRWIRVAQVAAGLAATLGGGVQARVSAVGAAAGVGMGVAQQAAQEPVPATASGGSRDTVADATPAGASLVGVPAGGTDGAAAGAAGNYRLGPDDQIEVTLYGQPDMPLRLRVKQDGTVSLPLMGSVTAAGETPVGLAEKIRGDLVAGGYLRDPRVNVEVTSYVSRSVTLLGAVVRPGIYPLQGALPLSRVLATAGGQREGSETVVLRRGDAPPQRFAIAALAGGGAGDPPLQAGDLLFVPAAEHFYIYGQVRAPGSFPIRAGMTFRQALSQGGGPNDAGTQNRIRLTRAGQQDEIEDLDAPVQDGDVMFVRERLF